MSRQWFLDGTVPLPFNFTINMQQGPQQRVRNSGQVVWHQIISKQTSDSDFDDQPRVILRSVDIKILKPIKST